MREWRTCPQNRNYVISNDGICMSKQHRFDGKCLRAAFRSHSDVYVLCKNYSKKAYPIKYLVYTAFIGPVPKGYVVVQKDGDRNNNCVENLFIMPLKDKFFYFSKRNRVLPKISKIYRYTFSVGDVNYESSAELLKDYPFLGTRQNLIQQADRWLKGEAARGKIWNPEGFCIRGVTIKAYREKRPNITRQRMNRVCSEYNLKQK